MLVLSRKVLESVEMRDKDGKHLGRVTVTQIKPGKVRLGFDGDGIEFVRDEIATTTNYTPPKKED